MPTTIEILIAEDSPTQAEQLRNVLETHGYRVIVARNGREALDAMHHRPSTLVITDIVMPEMDGYELCRQIKADPGLNPLPVMLVSSLSDPMDVIRGLECRADSFIVKPWEERHLLSRIAFLLANQQMRETDKVQLGIEVHFAGKKFLINSDRLQILSLLLSTYETAVETNGELVHAQDELRTLNEHLEERVRERTIALEAEVAQRKQAEEALRQREAELKEAQRVAHAGNWVWEPETDTVTWSEEIYRIFGLDPTQPVPRLEEQQRILTPESWARLKPAMEKAVETGAPYELDLELIRADGTKSWINARGETVRDASGRVVRLRGTAHDIAERKQAEKALLQSEHNFRGSLENSLDGILVVDCSGQIVFANLAAADIFGQSQEQLLGSAFGYPMISGQNTELDVVNSSGRTAIVEMRMAQTVWEGNLSCVISLRDITQRKHSEQQLRFGDEELKRANQNLVERNAEIQKFYHTLSHELKTPLTSAREFVSILMDGLAGPLNETQMEYLGIAKESCDQLRLYINDMLDVTRLETGKMSLDFQTAPLGSLVETVVKMLAPAAEGKKLSLSCDCQPDLRDIPFDKQRILQVITNLITNAIKFTPAGGLVCLGLSEAPADSECLQVVVRDTGRGITADQLGLIFNRLHQAHRDDALAESRSGLGLGLYICQELVQLHGGRIWAESELGQGSTFTFTIPKRQAQARQTLLVVDDEVSIRVTLRSLLEKAGYQVTLAASGAEALEWMRQELPALVILDLQMPTMHGAETLQQIRAKWGDVPVILHTGYPHGDLMNQAVTGAPFTVLAKPAPMEQILNTVRALARWNHETAGQKQSQPVGMTREDLSPNPVNRPSHSLQLKP
jgi:PAS domain S-box-containing protein